MAVRPDVQDGIDVDEIVRLARVGRRIAVFGVPPLENNDFVEAALSAAAAIEVARLRRGALSKMEFRRLEVAAEMLNDAVLLVAPVLPGADAQQELWAAKGIEVVFVGGGQRREWVAV